jgi:hypothetical protein
LIVTDDSKPKTGIRTGWGGPLEELKKYINSKQSVISQVIALRLGKDEESVIEKVDSQDNFPLIQMELKKMSKTDVDGCGGEKTPVCTDSPNLSEETKKTKKKKKNRREGLNGLEKLEK